MVPSLERSRLTTSGVPTRPVGGQAGPELTTEIGHRLEIGNTAAVNPLEDLAGVELGRTALGERLFQLMQLEFRDVRDCVVVHGDPIARVEGRKTFYCTMRRTLMCRAAAWYHSGFEQVSQFLL